MGVKAYEIKKLSEIHYDKKGAEKLPGIDFPAVFSELQANDVKHVEITITQIVDWDIAPMRKYLHGVVISAFTKKYNETCKHPHSGHFHTAEVKDFLKAKFLGWDSFNENWNKWSKLLKMDQPIKDIFGFFEIQEFNKTLMPAIQVKSTEALTPEQYMIFINDCENYYFELFQETYDTREKPVL